jgi:hypothetical protein
MSKLSRKTKIKQKVEEASGKKVMLYVFIGLIIVAVLVGFLVS